MEATFFGLGPHSIWPRPHSHLGWPHGLMANHQNLVMNELQPSVTEYFLQVVVTIATVVSCQIFGSSMALTLSFNTIMTVIAIFLELNELNSN